MSLLAFALACWLQNAPTSAAPAPETAPPAVNEWLATRAHPLAQLAQALAGAPRPTEDGKPTVVLVGRPFDGTRQVLDVARELCAGAYDVIALDVGFSEGEAAHAFVQGTDGKASAVSSTFGPLGWSPVEAAALLDALRALPKKPAVVGIGVGSPKSMSEEALDLLGKLLPATQARSEFVLSPLRSDGVNGRPRYYQLDENQRGVLRFGLGEIRDMMSDIRPDASDTVLTKAFDRCSRLIVAILQYEETMRFEQEPVEEDPRGRILAQNLALALEGRPKNTRVLALVRSRDLARSSDTTSFAARLAGQGNVDVTCAAIVAGEAVFQAFDPNDHTGGPLVPRDVTLTAEGMTALERSLRAVASEPTWFDLRSAPREGGAAEWFAAPRRVRSSGAICGGPIETPWDHLVTRDFDVLVWLPKLERAAALPAR